MIFQIMAKENIKFEFPTPPSIPINDHFQWKEMIDSVLEFIASSRTTLAVLTQKLHQRELQMILEQERAEDKSIKNQFYKECLKMNLLPDLNLQRSKIVQNPSTDNQEIEEQNKKDNKKDTEHKDDLAEEAIKDMKRRSKYLASFPRHRFSMRGKNQCVADPFIEGSNSFMDKSLPSKKCKELGYREIYKTKMLNSKGDSQYRY